ncbi:MAG: tRNA uracil 4-sulfurtransferase ThiI [Nitrososphaerota archaeon]
MVNFDSIVVHYGEITLKRGKRVLYEKLLKDNLAKATGRKVRRLMGRLIVKLEDKDEVKNLIEKIGKVFGVVWYAPAIHLERNGLEKLRDQLINTLRRESINSFKLEVKRSDKTFPLTSIEIARRIGLEISRELGIKVDLENPEKTIYIEVTEDGYYIFFEKIRGPGGLPVGSTGRMISLFSGGIDSPVASWLMMKRGCKIDLLHIHSGLSSEEILGTKIGELAKVLASYGQGLKLYLAPFKPFILKSFEIPPKMILVTFRAYMLKLADKIAKENGYLGIVTGDSLGQVASQTLENLYVVSRFTETPIYRPLIGMDKQEIIDIAKKIGTYELSIKEYRDCCAIIAKHPETKAKLDQVEKIWRDVNLDETVEETLKEVTVHEF